MCFMLLLLPLRPLACLGWPTSMLLCLATGGCDPTATPCRPSCTWLLLWMVVVHCLLDISCCCLFFAPPALCRGKLWCRHQLQSMTEGKGGLQRLRSWLLQHLPEEEIPPCRVTVFLGWWGKSYMSPTTQ